VNTDFVLFKMLPTFLDGEGSFPKKSETTAETNSETHFLGDVIQTNGFVHVFFELSNEGKRICIVKSTPVAIFLDQV
jgi:hypothetical protein